jgi:hypothetical protein
MLLILAKDIHSSLLRKFVNYGRKKFYNIVPWLEILEGLQLFKKFYKCIEKMGLNNFRELTEF